MRLYLDTEFNGHGGELISMALVQNRGEHFYAASYFDQPTDPWVRENVLPKLDAPNLRPGVFRAFFLQFIKQFDNPEIICDYFADAIHFCSLLAGPTYETSIYFPFSITMLVTPTGQPISKTPHNALADAIALRDWYESILQLDKELSE